MAALLRARCLQDSIRFPALARSTALGRWHRLRVRTRTLSSQGTTDLEREVLKRGTLALLSAYQRYGHYEARLDPLGLRAVRRRPELEVSQYFPPGFMDMSLDRSLLPSSLPSTINTPSQLDAFLRSLHCGAVGFEFFHLDDPEQRNWLTNRVMELFGSPISSKLTPSERLNAANLMVQAETFEAFMAKKFPSFKRYSGEGAEGMQAALDAIFRTALTLGVQEAVIGMPHRGRLAFLVSQLRFPARRLFFKVPGHSELDSDELEGVVDDVISHLSASVDKSFPTMMGEAGGGGGDGSSPVPPRPLHVSLLHNPSHLEIVGSVAAGKTRAKIASGSTALCLQVHGDAAMAGQGVTQETLALASLPGFTVGGSIHLVVNNQLGFTTGEVEGRGPSTYCTDVAKMAGVPIIHVNGECIGHILLACKLAVEYRQQFQRDVMIDLVVYRKHGHNEVDEPGFTQPAMYREVRRPDRPSPTTVYTKQLMQEGLLTEDRLQKLGQQLESHLENEYQASQSYEIKTNRPDYLGGKWKKLRHAKGEDLHRHILTGVPIEVLHHVGLASVAMPEGRQDTASPPFAIHQRLERTFVGARLKLLDEGKVDWATAEALALGSLCAQGFDVRLCGQDVQRGTFSQRHMVLTDQETGELYCPLAHVPGSTGRLEVVNSNLSELAVMGFELGYSWEDPRNLVMWEAQFGDFANGAQMIIDTFVSGSEAKWLRQTGLVLLLPHGYDGALCDAPGLAPSDVDVPEAANSNMVVINPTTPANYFHALRRQQLRPFRKPLVVVAPKTLLRHLSAISSLEDMTIGTSFSPVFATTLTGKPIPPGSAAVTTVLFCSGKVYYDIVKAASSWEEKGLDQTVAVIRLEELAPFPTASLKHILQETCPAASSFSWVQEEPLNAGAWSFVAPHIERILRQRSTTRPAEEPIPPRLRYIGRPSLPTPAAGLSKANAVQWNVIVDQLRKLVMELSPHKQ